jgi:hypothetical protein
LVHYVAIVRVFPRVSKRRLLEFRNNVFFGKRHVTNGESPASAGPGLVGSGAENRGFGPTL